MERDKTSQCKKSYYPINRSTIYVNKLRSPISRLEVFEFLIVYVSLINKCTTCQVVKCLLHGCITVRFYNLWTKKVEPTDIAVWFWMF